MTGTPRPPRTDDLWKPPGHYYSPIPDLEEIEERAPRLFGRPPEELPGIELNREAQLALLGELLEYYGREGFVRVKSSERRYFADNVYFSYSDAFFLHALLRHYRPARLVEIGSGFSSAVMLDTDERELESSIEFTFVDPNPERLHSLLSPADRQRTEIHVCPVQELELGLFDRLQANDVLFIDSSHVAKTGSDVNHLLFDVLPRLHQGVLVHVHDVPYPFEYPREWVDEGRAWNEVYALRAFLSYNSAFEILLYPSFLASLNMDRARSLMPNCVDPVSSSLWMRRTSTQTI